MLNASSITNNMTNETNSYGTYENEKNKKNNDVRLTADPDTDIEDTKFDFDGLQDESEEACDLLLPKITRCHGDDSESVSYLTCCNCGVEEYEYYGYRYKSSTYCNECALNICGKLIEKPKYAFSRLPVKAEQIKFEFVYCDECNYMMLDEEKIKHNGDILCSCCYNDIKLLYKYSAEQCVELINYAEKHNLTIEESIDYQTHCHCCGKTVDDGIFDERNHQYCKKKCFEYCEDYWYECFRGEDCKVCGIWEYRTRRDSLTAHDIELSDGEPILATIDCFKELNVYPQLCECIEDLVEYFDSDCKWRYDCN